MPDMPKLNKPWLVAAWPGMGHVAITGAYYLMAKLQMYELSEFPSHDLFDVEHVEVKNGVLRPARMPRSRFFLWQDPRGQRDILLFIGEAQPQTGKYAFCHRLLEYVRAMGVEQVFTFAAMVTDMHPEADSRVYGVATDKPTLKTIRLPDVEIMKDGHIGGLNGVLLAAAAEHGLRGTGLLGEMPGMAPQVPYPKASLAVLRIFAQLADITVDLSDLEEYGRSMQEQLMDLIRKMQDAMRRRADEPSEGEPPQESFLPPPEEQPAPDEPRVTDEDRRRIEELFERAQKDRSDAFHLKKELDRLDVFKEYENRFLDLFKKQ